MDTQRVYVAETSSTSSGSSRHSCSSEGRSQPSIFSSFHWQTDPITLMTHVQSFGLLQWHTHYVEWWKVEYSSYWGCCHWPVTHCGRENMKERKWIKIDWVKRENRIIRDDDVSPLSPLSISVSHCASLRDTCHLRAVKSSIINSGYMQVERLMTRTNRNTAQWSTGRQEDVTPTSKL